MKATVGVAVVLALAGCSAGGTDLPRADEFRDGVCRQAAEPVLALARIADRNDGARTVGMTDRKALATHQAALKKLQPDAELAEPVTALVTAIGFVRIRLDGRTYVPALLRDMDKARATVQTRCVP